MDERDSKFDFRFAEATFVSEVREALSKGAQGAEAFLL